MSKRETPMIEKYWNEVGGVLIKEFLLVPHGDGHGYRRADAIIIQGEDKVDIPTGKRDISLEGKDVIVVQAKANRLGMHLMGQGLFSYELIKKYHNPKSVQSVLLCTENDIRLNDILSQEPYKMITVKPMPEFAKSRKKKEELREI